MKLNTVVVDVLTHNRHNSSSSFDDDDDDDDEIDNSTGDDKRDDDDDYVLFLMIDRFISVTAYDALRYTERVKMLHKVKQYVNRTKYSS